jgi:sugar lactone lactonase YvrE
MDSNGRRARPFFDEPSYRGWPVWSWGGDWLYFIELDSYTLARMRPDGSGRERLNDFPHPEAYQGLAVGPDESLWYSYRQAEGYLQIYHWRPGESQTWALPNPSQASQVWPAPSPDGRHLYYIQADRLMRFDLAAQTAQDISPGGAYKYNSPAPSPIIALAWGGWLNLSAGLGLLMLGLWRVYVQS